MDDGNYSGRDCGGGLYYRRAVDSDRELKINDLLKKITRIALFVMLPWNVYAEAGRFPGVQEQLDGLVNVNPLTESSPAVTSSSDVYAAVSFEAPSEESVPGQASITVVQGSRQDVSAGSKNARSDIDNQALAALDVESSQPGLIISRDTASLEVVDTGASRKVQNPQPVTLEIRGKASASPETDDELNTGAASSDDQPVRNYKHMLPVTDVTEKHQIAVTMTEETGGISGNSGEISAGATNEESVRLPYPVLLAILALMSLIPVARRNG